MRWLTQEGLATTFLFVVWALCNPYFEIDRSSLIYSARALADLDPAGVGRDLMFVFDGQSGFTLFTAIFRTMMRMTGPAIATLLVTVASVVVSFAGTLILVRTICTGRARIMAMVFAAALPASYGGYKLFSYAEAAATPRPFAEALVLAGLAALVRDRHGLAAVALCGAVLLHPIMACPGVMVMMIWLVLRDRRWLIPIGAVALAILAVAAAHVAPMERLTTFVDPDWRSILVDRNPQLFPTLWPDGWAGRYAARAATLIIAASLTPGPVRKLLLIATGVGLLGCALAYVCDERLPIVLLVQAQSWRTTWLVFSLATIAAAICTVELWTRGGAARVVLMLLALSWAYADHHAAILLAATAVAFHFCVDPRHAVLSKRVSGALVGSMAVLVIIGLAQAEIANFRLVGTAPADMIVDARRTLAVGWDYTPAAFAGAVCIMVGFIPTRRSTLIALILCGSTLLYASWDRRSAANRVFDSGASVPDLVSIVDRKPGEVFWVGGVRESWSWLGRPQWISAIQGAGLVFSRPLAMIYRDRAERAVSAGLVDGSILAPFANAHEDGSRPIDTEKVRLFCAAPDAPAWLVVPAIPGRSVPEALKPVHWVAPVVKLEPVIAADSSMSWRRISSYDIIACAG